MRIILATPLYPPDVARPAPYVKELSKRLKEKHQVTIVAYGHLPEKVPGVRIVAVSKSRPLPMRLIAYTIALWRAARGADLIYAQNGTSVELPAGLVALFAGRPLVMCLGDTSAHERATKSNYLKKIEHFALNRARAVVTNLPPQRPEILPFEPMPETQLQAYEKSWGVHVETLEKIFKDSLHAQ